MNFLVGVPLHTLADDAAFEGIEGSEQSGRAAPLIVVSHGAAAPLLQRQAGLGAIEDLDLALLID